ncbi:MAG TPA: GxxExxY protein [Longimicrobium sp.]|nr:GxxExxY protein [Longimicrobium sp.]
MHRINELTGRIINVAYALHNRLGPGLLESVYEAIFARMLQEAGFRVERQKPAAIEIDGIRFDEGFRVDLLVEDEVVVELKAVEQLTRVHARQVLSYLRLLNLPIGLVINFGAPLLKDGLCRIVNTHAPGARSILDEPSVSASDQVPVQSGNSTSG